MSVFPIGRPFLSDPSRIRGVSSSGVFGNGPVVYVCDREMRAESNRGLFFAGELANDRKAPLVVAGVSDTSWSFGNFRHLVSEAGSLSDMEASLKERGVPLFPFFGDRAVERAESFVRETGPAALVFDFSPLAPQLYLRKRLAAAAGVPAFEVDARCAVPARTVSDKAEIGARTLRPKFWRAFAPVTAEDVRRFESFPDVEVPYAGPTPESVADTLANAECDRSVAPVEGFVSGEDEARRLLSEFVSRRLPGYAEKRNDPNSGASSGLSPYFRNGNLSPEETVFAVRNSAASQEDQESFLEECLIRRELSENYCLHNPRYAEFAGAPAWALDTLEKHASDRREFLYSEAEFESASTHDDLWNACQRELLKTGKIASYLRMYWAKKILEWSASPTEAHRIALRLNDRYAIDGRSPNGYVGVLWAVAGLHDRPWFERDVYGIVRYMNRSGCERKFDVPAYVAKW